MDILDLILIALVALLGYSGYRRGLTWGGLATLGLIVGSVVGAWLAPWATKMLTGGATNQPRPHQAPIAAGIFLTCVLLIQGIGTAVGFRLRTRTLRSRFGRWDSIAGSIAGGFGVVVAAWFLGFLFVSGQTPWLSDQVRNSGIERSLAAVAPAPPGFLAKIRQYLSDEAVNPFAGFSNGQLPPQPIPADVNSVGVQRAAHVVSRVIASSTLCGGAEAGTAWPVADDRFVTNAHVVAGSDHIEIETPDGRSLRATLVYFDPEVDIAILSAPGSGLSPLTLATDPPAPGTPSAAIGYPAGGAEKTTQAAVRGVQSATGFDIYFNGTTVTRNIVIASAQIVPGDSGGPLLNLNGEVIGLVFGSATDQKDVGYALSVPEITPGINSGRGATSPVESGGCTHN